MPTEPNKTLSAGLTHLEIRVTEFSCIIGVAREDRWAAEVL
jgi:hypothetical protein